jgi:hypothetical protein
MVGNNAPELRYLTPLMLFHSFWSWRDYPGWGDKNGDMTGSILSIDLDWAVFPGFAVYAQFVMNEFSTPYERKNWPDEQPPNGLGYLLGIEYARSLNSWQTLFYGEAVYTDPYLYTLSSPFSSYIWMRRLSDLFAKDLRYSWIGHPEGRDILLFSTGAGFSKANLSLSADISFISRGEHTIAWDWEMSEKAGNERAPSGTTEHRLNGGLGAVWRPFQKSGGSSSKPSPLANLSFSGYIGGVMLLNAQHRDAVNEYGLEAMFSAAFTY